MASIHAVPTEVCMQILEHVDCNSFLNLRRTCTFWKALVDDCHPDTLANIVATDTDMKLVIDCFEQPFKGLENLNGLSRNLRSVHERFTSRLSQEGISQSDFIYSMMVYVILDSDLLEQEKEIESFDWRAPGHDWVTPQSDFRQFRLPFSKAQFYDGYEPSDDLYPNIYDGPYDVSYRPERRRFFSARIWHRLRETVPEQVEGEVQSAKNFEDMCADITGRIVRDKRKKMIFLCHFQKRLQSAVEEAKEAFPHVKHIDDDWWRHLILRNTFCSIAAECTGFRRTRLQDFLLGKIIEEILYILWANLDEQYRLERPLAFTTTWYGQHSSKPTIEYARALSGMSPPWRVAQWPMSFPNDLLQGLRGHGARDVGHKDKRYPEAIAAHYMQWINMCTKLTLLKYQSPQMVVVRYREDLNPVVTQCEFLDRIPEKDAAYRVWTEVFQFKHTPSNAQPCPEMQSTGPIARYFLDSDVCLPYHLMPGDSRYPFVRYLLDSDDSLEGDSDGDDSTEDDLRSRFHYWSDESLSPFTKDDITAEQEWEDMVEFVHRSCPRNDIPFRAGFNTTVYPENKLEPSSRESHFELPPRYPWKGFSWDSAKAKWIHRSIPSLE